MQNRYEQIELDKLRKRFCQLRIVDVRAEAAMEKSMRTYGQLTPVVVAGLDADGYQIIDGFKRFRAAAKLGLSGLQAQIFAGNMRAAKAAMIHLNTTTKTISALEKGLVIQSLHRHEKLSQTQIATMLGRHKSWVCRLLAVVEQLSDQVSQHLQLGLINMTVARELARLPHGNQAKALQAVIQYKLTSDETARLVRLLQKKPQWAHGAIVAAPRQALEKNQTHRPPVGQHAKMMEKLIKMEIWVTTTPLDIWQQLPVADRQAMTAPIQRIQAALERLRTAIETKEPCNG